MYPWENWRRGAQNPSSIFATFCASIIFSKEKEKKKEDRLVNFKPIFQGFYSKKWQFHYKQLLHGNQSTT